MRRAILILVLPFLVFGVTASRSLPLFEGMVNSASSIGLGRCAVLVPASGYQGLDNPAGTGLEDVLTIRTFTSRPYSVPDLLMGSIWVSRGWKPGGVGAGVSLFGNDIYREERCTWAVSRCSGRFRYGISCTLNRLVIDGLGHRSFWSLALGLAYRTDPEGLLEVGGVVRDIARLGDDIRQDVRPEAATSISVFVRSTGARLFVEMRGSSRYPVAVSMGVELRLWSRLTIRMGTGKNPSLYSVGLGLTTSFLSIDLGVEEHTVLGQTRSVSVTFTPSAL